VVSYERQIETLRRKIGRLQTWWMKPKPARPDRREDRRARIEQVVKSIRTRSTPPANYRWWVLALPASAR